MNLICFNAIDYNSTEPIYFFGIISKSSDVERVKRLAWTILIEPFNNKYFAYQISNLWLQKIALLAFHNNANKWRKPFDEHKKTQT